MPAALDTRGSPNGASPPGRHALAYHRPEHSRQNGTPPQVLSLPKAASKLDQGLWCLIAQGLDDERFWLAFSRLYRDLTDQLPETERRRLAYHADYALARLGLPVWTVMAESAQLSSSGTKSEPGPDGALSVAAAA